MENARGWARSCSPRCGGSAAVPAYIGAVHGKGLVASLHMVKPGGIEPDPESAGDVVRRASRRA